MASVSRESVHWEDYARYGALSGAGEELATSLLDQGVTNPDGIIAAADRLAQLEPPIQPRDDGLPGAYGHYMRGVHNVLQTAGLINAGEQQ